MWIRFCLFVFCSNTGSLKSPRSLLQSGSTWAVATRQQPSVRLCLPTKTSSNTTKWGLLGRASRGAPRYRNRHTPWAYPPAYPPQRWMGVGTGRVQMGWTNLESRHLYCDIELCLSPRCINYYGWCQTSSHCKTEEVRRGVTLLDVWDMPWYAMLYQEDSVYTKVNDQSGTFCM